MSLLSLKGVYKSYRQGGMFGPKRRCEVLKDVHLTIAPAECLGLIGRSGSGKSTLGRLALCLETPDAGTVSYNGIPVDAMTSNRFREFRRNCQVVFQNAVGSVNPRFTAAEVIAEPLKNFNNPGARVLKNKIADLLKQVGLKPDDAEKYPHQFSGGELQRICIARAIALNPALIVLDEAVSSLDMLIQSKIVDLLNHLKESMGMAYLFISHDIRTLVKMADRLAVMHEGRIVETVNLKEMEQGPVHPALASLMGAVLPPLPAAAARN